MIAGSRGPCQPSGVDGFVIRPVRLLDEGKPALIVDACRQVFSLEPPVALVFGRDGAERPRASGASTPRRERWPTRYASPQCSASAPIARGMRSIPSEHHPNRRLPSISETG